MKRILPTTALLTLLLISTAFGAGKLSVDPNTQPKPAAGLSGDLRLKQTVTYRAIHTPLKKVLVDLEAMTGVDLNAGVNSNDWTVRDRKVNIIVHDVALGELMKSIADVLQYQWKSTNVEGVLHYRIYVNSKLIADRKAQGEENERKYKKIVNDKRAALLSDILGNEGLTSQQMDELRKKSPALYVLERWGAGGVIRDTIKLHPELRDSILEGKKYSIYIRDLPSQLQDKVYSTLVQHNSTYPNPSNMSNMKKNFSEGCLIIQWEGGLDHLGTSYVACPPDYSFSKGCILTWFHDPNTDAGKTRAEIEIQSLDSDGQKNWNQFKPGERITHDKALEKNRAEERSYFSTSTVDPLIEHEKEDWMNQYVKFSSTPVDTRFRNVVAMLAEAGNKNIVSDSFASSGGSIATYETEKEVKLGDILDSLAKGYECNWYKNESIIEFRNRSWLYLWDSQIPDEWVKNWSNDVKTKGHVTIDTLASISALTSGQIYESFIEDEVLGTSKLLSSLRQTVFKLEEPLSIYRTLSPEQKRMAGTEAGLPLGVTTTIPDQLSAVSKVLETIKTTKGPKYANLQISDSVLHFIVKPKIKSMLYQFWITGHDDVDFWWENPMPVYMPK